jgi:hypothetical protein
MTTEVKKQTELNIIDSAGERLLRARLPPHWILRQYRPDFGLDFALEIFAEEKAGRISTYETLGEHIFIQLKTTRTVDARPLEIFGRYNVEKAREALDRQDLVGTLRTARFSLETSELITVERMGIGVPVLLVLADLENEKCYFVCLNDYIDKILVPRHDDYTAKQNRTIHIPLANDVSDPVVGHTALRWYGKRSKLLAAFQRFVFQASELGYAWGTESFLPMARYFATKIVRYDFWNDTEMCGIIGRYGRAVERFLSSGDPGLMTIDFGAIEQVTHGDDPSEASAIVAELKLKEVLQLWRGLAVLPKNYEDVWREWHLPTSLGYATSYPGGTT